MKNKIKELNEEIWGESPLTFYFSFQGVFNRLQFFGAVMTINLFFRIIYAQEILFLTLLSALLVFYAMLAVIQKRSRDLKMKGTLFILSYSMFFPVLIYSKLLGIENVMGNNYLKNIFCGIIILYILVVTFLVFMPGSKEKDLSLTSPLLKHPKIYTIACLAIAFIVFYTIHTLG